MTHNYLPSKLNRLYGMITDKAQITHRLIAHENLFLCRKEKIQEQLLSAMMISTVFLEASSKATRKELEQTKAQVRYTLAIAVIK